MIGGIAPSIETGCDLSQHLTAVFHGTARSLMFIGFWRFMPEDVHIYWPAGRRSRDMLNKPHLSSKAKATRRR